MRNSILPHPNAVRSKNVTVKTLHRCTQSTLRLSFRRRPYKLFLGTQPPEVSWHTYRPYSHALGGGSRAGMGGGNVLSFTEHYDNSDTNITGGGGGWKLWQKFAKTPSLWSEDHGLGSRHCIKIWASAILWKNRPSQMSLSTQQQWVAERKMWPFSARVLLNL